MTKYLLTKPGGPWDFPALGFSAVDGAILDGDLPVAGTFTSTPGPEWSTTTGTESGITRYAPPSTTVTYSPVPVPQGLVDSVGASLLTPGSPAQVALNAAIAAQSTRTYDIRRYVQTGEVLGGATDGDNAAIFQRAVDALTALYNVDGKPRGIYVPAGDYRMATGLSWKDGVGLVGESESGTVLWAPTNAACISSNATPSAQRKDTYFANFTIDGARQTNPIYITHFKGFKYEYPLRCLVSHVTVRNTWGTGMAFDEPQELVMDHPSAIGCGRQIAVLGASPETNSGSSGIGNGVGTYDNESCLIINPYLANNGRAGLFFERPTYSTLKGAGIVVVGGLAIGNYIGYHDAGAYGAQVSMACVNNTCNGVRIDGTVLTNVGGKRGHFTGEVYGNGNAAYKRSAGVFIGAGGDGYTVSGKVYDNTGYGVLTVGADLSGGIPLGPGITIEADVFRNSKSGVILQALGTGPNGEVKHFRLVGASRNNGTDTAASFRDGLTVTVPTDMLTVTGSLTDDQAAPTQQYGLQILGSSKSASRVNLTGDVQGAAVAGINFTQVVNGRIQLLGGELGKAYNLRVTSATSAGGGQVAFAWSAPIPATGVTDYDLQYRLAGSGGAFTSFAHTASTATTLTVTGLTNRSAYEFQVAAKVGATVGTYSTAVVATPVTTPTFSDTFQRPAASHNAGTNDGGSGTPSAWAIYDLTGTNQWGTRTNFDAPPYSIVRDDTTLTSNQGTSVLYRDVGATGGVHRVMLASVDTAFTGHNPSWPYVGLAFRVQDASHYWWLSIRRYGDAGLGYALQHYNGTGNPVIDLNLNTFIPTKGDFLEVRDKGTTIEVWVNDTLLGTYNGANVSLFSTATKAGLAHNLKNDYKTGYAFWSYAPS